MSRPPHLCGCGRTVPHGARCPCQRQSDRARKARFDRTRPSARQRGYDSAWEKARGAFLAEHPDCAMCGAPATTVDHKIPHRGNMVLFWNKSLWQSLCTSCHNRHKQRLERRGLTP